MIGKFFKVLVNATNGLKYGLLLNILASAIFGVVLLYFAYLYYHNRPLQPFLHIGFDFIIYGELHYIINK